MKFIRFIGFWLIMGCSVHAWAQQADHFIYLQSDTKQPFYVKLGATASPMASSGSGYLILPKIPQGTLSFWVGFPDNSFPEQHFKCTITADKGFLLKRFPDKGWALYDLQELTLTYANQPDNAVAPAQDTVKKPDPAPASAEAAQPPAVGAHDSASAAGQTAAMTVAPSAATAPETTAVQPPTNAVNGAAVSGTPTGTPATGPDTVTPTAPKGDAFESALAAVTKDSTLTDIKYVKKTAPAPVVPSPGTDASIVLVSRQVTDSGVELVYADHLRSGAVDTVQMLVPQKGAGVPATSQAPAGAAPATADTAAATAQANAPATVQANAPAAVQANAPAAVQANAPAAVQANLPATVPATNPAPTTAAPAGIPQDSASRALAAGFGVQPGTTSPSNAPATTTPDSTHAATKDTTSKTGVNQSVTPVDTTHAFNPATLVRTGKTKDTSNLVVPVFKQQDGGGAQDSASRALASGFGVQPGTTAPDNAHAATTDSGKTQGADNKPADNKPQGLVLANSNCTRVAGDEDYTKLRKRMASESDVDRMIELARKSFKKACFTTDQVRNLSFLFLQEDGRYKFIEEAYPFVSDSWNFKSLQSLFSSAYFINRFKALVER
ncbi:DUF4476 domain-containing protein [Dinghuibacter silviterrae]|uniref:DUF4476 domain-containing protein n=1 Tax=Dinghuibacter silviterrae TaxID=1539049 RepID=A0A4R8DNZ2_9BACT|nr:DUF4476 domain-containing protein [Dinghuibacter silviterrae]TDW98996.1 hypothetical protein EDB95_0002 [Dinghuibacter silviterrae]